MKPNISSNKRTKYKQGIFKPKHLEKYIGDPTNIVYRSSWEKIFLNWCDNNPAVIKYNSEETIIPYLSPIDGKVHRYFVDFLIITKQNDNTYKKYLVEIKPFQQTKPPRKSSKQDIINENKYNNKVQTYLINQAKWTAAKKYASVHNCEFIILTEKEIFKQKVKKR